jgi:copper chaperone CopZ
MKKIVTLLCLGILVNEQINAQIQKLEIVATGLTCSMCSNAIQKQIKTLADVKDVDIDLNKNMFVVQLKPNSQTAPSVFKDKVEKAGFFVGSMIAYVNFNNISVDNNTVYNNFTFVDVKPQVLNGVYKLKLLNKGFVTAKEFKQLAQQYLQYPNYTKSKHTLFVKLI